jgi:hypothetical protein
MGQKIELGKAHTVGTGVVSEPKTLNERINLLEKSMRSLTQAFNAINSAIVKDGRQQEVYDDLSNKDGIPIGTSLLGQSTRGGTYVLSVKHNKYCIGTTEYDSLSAAAEAASGVRRSGWTFWRIPDGRTVKEVYGKTNG